MTENTQVRCLTTMLTYALKGKKIPKPQLEELMQGVDEQALFELARAHAVAPLIYDVWNAYPKMQSEVKKELQSYTTGIVGHSYRLLFYTKYLVGLLEEAGLTVAVLKGVATAEFYPQPELRKAGDVDLLLFTEENCARAVECFIDHGFTRHEAGTHLHHVAMIGAEGIEVELHSMMVEPFDNQATNRIMMQYQKQAQSHLKGLPFPC